MFGKAKSPRDESLLSERMRKAVARETAPPPATLPFSRQIERAVRQAVFRQGALILVNGEKLRGVSFDQPHWQPWAASRQ